MARKKKNMTEYTSVETLIGDIIKEHGDGSVTMGATTKRIKCDSIPTGALNVDLAIGIGGIPRGRITEIYGPESSGKTTLALTIAANAQLKGKVAFVDVEHALDPTYAEAIGLDMDDAIISQPDSAEQALDIVETLCGSGLVDLVVVDSVAALVPLAELEGTMGQSHVGLQARLLSQACRKLVGIVRKTNTSLVFINQIREKIGVMFGSPETTSGGRALKFYSSVRIDIRRIGTLKEGDAKVANATRVKIVKNKVGSPFKQAEFDIVFGEGINRVGCILDVGVDKDVVAKRGSNYYYNNIRMGNGRVASCAYLNDNPDIMLEIRKKVLEKDLAPEPEEASGFDAEEPEAAVAD